MGKYSLRDGKIKTVDFEAESVKASSNEVSYVKINRMANSGLSGYLYVGTAGAILISSTVPVGTSGAFENKGFQVGTVA